MKLRLVQGGYRRDLPFVCTWCAGRFEDAGALTAHWVENADCRRNKGASNPTQTKYGDNDGGRDEQPGAETLRKVREKEAEHEPRL